MIRHSSIHQPTTAPPMKGSRKRAGIANRKRLSRLHSWVPVSNRRCMCPTVPHISPHHNAHGPKSRNSLTHSPCAAGCPSSRRTHVPSEARTSVRLMTGTVHHLNAYRHHETPPLALVAAPAPHRRPVSATVTLFAAGMTPGFLLAAAASSQGGAVMVRTALILAAASATVAVAAGVRARQIARRREQRLRERARLRRPASRAVAVRRAA